MEALVCDRCGEVSETVDQIGLVRLMPRHGIYDFIGTLWPKPRFLFLGDDGKYRHEKYQLEVSPGVYPERALMDLCPRCVEAALMWLQEQHRLRAVRADVKI